MITLESIDHWFTYHPPTKEQQAHYTALRDCIKVAAMGIYNHTPSSAEQTLAIRKLQEAVMWANTAIACAPKDDEDFHPGEPTR